MRYEIRTKNQRLRNSAERSEVPARRGAYFLSIRLRSGQVFYWAEWEAGIGLGKSWDLCKVRLRKYRKIFSSVNKQIKETKP